MGQRGMRVKPEISGSRLRAARVADLSGIGACTYPRAATSANGTILTTLLFAYIGYHERLLAHHQCSQLDCRLVRVHRQLLDLLESALDQTAHLLEDCDEEPEASEEDDEAE